MKRGFTLVELLAVIAILAIILVIAVPKVMDIIEKSRKEIFVSNANEVVSLAKVHYHEKYIGKLGDDVIVYTLKDSSIMDNDEKVKYAKDIDLTGTLEINNDGGVKLNIRNEFYCGIKSFSDEKMNVYKLTENECNN